MKCYSRILSHIFSRNALAGLLLVTALGFVPSVFQPQVIMAQGQGITVRGFVIGADKETLVGALVRVLPDGMVAQTDGYGKFELTKVPANAQLQVSYLGMKTAIIPLNGQTELNIELEQHTSNMPLSSSRVEEKKHVFLAKHAPMACQINFHETPTYFSLFYKTIFFDAPF